MALSKRLEPSHHRHHRHRRCSRTGPPAGFPFPRESPPTRWPSLLLFTPLTHSLGIPSLTSEQRVHYATISEKWRLLKLVCQKAPSFGRTLPLGKTNVMSSSPHVVLFQRYLRRGWKPIRSCFGLLYRTVAAVRHSVCTASNAAGRLGP